MQISQIKPKQFPNWKSAIFLVLVLAAPALAGPTVNQQDIFKSVNKNLDTPIDLSKVIPWVIVAVGLIIMAVLYNQRRERIGPVSKRLNHPGKLLREISRGIHLRKAEIKQLKMLADERELISPITLLLCPSVLAKSVRTRNPKIDRRVIEQLAQRLRQEKIHDDSVPQ